MIVRTLRHISVNAIVGVFYVLAVMLGYWSLDYLYPPILPLETKVVAINYAQNSILTEVKFTWERRCDGSIIGWIRSEGPEPPPNNWAQVGSVDLPPAGFMGEKHSKGDIVTRRIDIPLGGYVPRSASLYLPERAFRCNPLLRVFPMVVRFPAVEFRPEDYPG